MGETPNIANYNGNIFSVRTQGKHCLGTMWCTRAEWGDTGLAMNTIGVIKVLCLMAGTLHLANWAFEKIKAAPL